MGRTGVTSRQQAKGDRAERELAALLEELTGWRVSRKLGVGRSDDTGDLDGIPATVAQVKHYDDVLRAIREVIADLPTQRANAGVTHAVGFVRRRGGRWVAVMDLETWATWAREALNPPDS